MMAVRKATRPNSLAQPQPQHAKTARAKKPRRINPHHKAELFDDLRQLNRGYGTALAALSRLQRPGIFPAACLRTHHNRTEALRAQANRDLLQFLTGREEKDAQRFLRLSSQTEKPGS
jgi:hypothetical protein